MVINEESANGVINGADWALISNNREFLDNYQFTRHIREGFWKDKKSVLWTDDFSNLSSLLKY